MLKRQLSLLVLALFLLVCLSTLAGENSAAIGGYVFLDVRANGNPEGAERIAGILITLTDGEDRELASVTTDENGAFAFTDLAKGDYRVIAQLENKHVASPMTKGGSMALPGEGNTMKTPTISLETGQKEILPIGAITKSSRLVVTAFGDDNANGGRFSTEPLLQNVVVNLLYEYEGESYVVGSAVTNKKGAATIGPVTPGVYRLSATMPDPYIIGPLGLKINPFYNVIVPTGDMTGQSEPLTLPTGGSLGVGVGGVMTGKAQGTFWYDTNANGIKDANEPGFAGASLVVTDSAGNSRETKSLEDGSYGFTLLGEGSYTLTVFLPEGMMFAPGKETVITSDTKATGQLHFSVVTGQTTGLGSIGVTQASSVSLTAFIDENADGIMDPGEAPLENVMLTLSVGQEKAQATTGPSGIATFPIVRAGSFFIEASLSEGLVFSNPAQGELSNQFFAQTAQNTLSITSEVALNQQASLLLGATQAASVQGRLFSDDNLNSQKDAGEAGLASFLVSAVNSEGQVVLETLTNSDGDYELSPLIPGTYSVHIALQSPYVFSPPLESGQGVYNRIVSQDVGGGHTKEYSLLAGQSLQNIDAAAFKSAVITGSVLLGDEISGFEGNVGGLEGVLVELRNPDGSKVADYTQATTDANGFFNLKGALPGTYRLQYTLPEKCFYSKPLIDVQVVATDTFSLEAGEKRKQATIFAVETGMVGGTVFEDLSANGLLSQDDSFLQGASLVLTNAKGEKRSHITDESGQFLFDMLRPGNYALEVTLPENMLVYKSPLAVIRPVQSNTFTAPVKVTMGQEQLDCHIAGVKDTTLLVNAFLDHDLSKTKTEGDEPYGNFQVSLIHDLTGLAFPLTLDERGQATAAHAFPGSYRYMLTLPEDYEVYGLTAPIGGQWTSSFLIDSGNTTLDLPIVQFGSLEGAVWNLDGTLTDVANLPLRLICLKTGNILQALTNQKGEYSFTHLYPGSYQVECTLPLGYRYARLVDTANRPSIIVAGAQGVENEIGRSQETSIFMGENKMAQDIGMGTHGGIGDTAWLDLNGNGLQDFGEPGIPGLAISMYQYGELVAQTTTNEYGFYQFTELYPGAYTMKIELEDSLITTAINPEYPLLTSVFPAGQVGIAVAENIIVKGKTTDLNVDIGLTPRTPGVLPSFYQYLPKKDWTPYH